ncbi:MAG: AAA family ATPase [Saprospiraceae bacterium]
MHKRFNLKENIVMIIDFEVTNFRSIKDTASFSFEAGASKSHKNNYFEKTLDGDDTIRLLKTAAIYGANGSGKSNVLKAFAALHYFVLRSHSFDAGDDIVCHEPFLLNTATKSSNSPIIFKLTFIGEDNIKYIYEVRFSRQEVLFERLEWYPGGNQNYLFERSKEGGHSLKAGPSFSPKVTRKFAANKLVLSVLGNDAHEQLEPIYLWFKKSKVGNLATLNRLSSWERQVKQRCSEDTDFSDRLAKMLRLADTGIKALSVQENPDDAFRFPNTFPSELKTAIMENNRFGISASFEEFDSGKFIKLSTEISWENQSSGTQILFTIGGMMLLHLEEGGLIIVDELNSSLHPDLCAFLVGLFHNPNSNPINAQLLFATHDIQLLAEDRFRKDQFWLTQKNKFGETELYSAQDFKEVRDTTPLDKWYVNGKFYGKPRIKETEFIYG